MNRNFTKEDVLRIANEKEVGFIHLQFTDVAGVMKNLTITLNQLEDALDNELMFDGSSIDGFVRIEESDMYLYPDPTTFVIFPWSTPGAVEARLICDVYKPDGTPFDGCPRQTLKRAIKKAEDMGYTMNVGPECEFFLFSTDESGEPTLETHDQAGYFDLAPVDMGGSARNDMVKALQDMHFLVEASHHEVAEGQHEIDFKFDNALRAADSIMTFKMVVRIMAQRHGLHATFMPKPVAGINGSGMHMNMSLSTLEGKNAFYDAGGDMQLSEIAYQYIAGLVKNAKGFAALTNPTVNSYKRLVPGYEAPTLIAWSASNRSPLIRIPAKRGAGTRVELRNPDPSANPYLAITAALAAGLDGIENKMTPPPATNINVYHATQKELDELQIKELPSNLKEAIFELDNNDVIKNALGGHVYEALRATALAEWKKFSLFVSEWELKTYLKKF
mgnify:CR=1 FL=1